MKEVTVMLELDEWELKKLDEFAALRRKTEIIPRPENCYTYEATLQYIFCVVSFDSMVDEATAWVKGLLKNRKEAVSEFWEVEPLEDDEAGPEEPETFSDPGELPHVETLVPFGEPEEPETLIPIRDADGVRRMATLDEVEAMREAAQGIYAGEPPEPKEPETESNAEELPAVRRGPLMDDKSDLYFYLLEGRNAV